MRFADRAGGQRTLCTHLCDVAVARRRRRQPLCSPIMQCMDRGSSLPRPATNPSRRRPRSTALVYARIYRCATTVTRLAPDARSYEKSVCLRCQGTKHQRHDRRDCPSCAPPSESGCAFMILVWSGLFPQIANAKLGCRESFYAAKRIHSSRN